MQCVDDPARHTRDVGIQVSFDWWGLLSPDSYNSLNSLPTATSSAASHTTHSHPSSASASSSSSHAVVVSAPQPPASASTAAWSGGSGGSRPGSALSMRSTLDPSTASTLTQHQQQAAEMFARAQSRAASTHAQPPKRPGSGPHHSRHESEVKARAEIERVLSDWRLLSLEDEEEAAAAASAAAAEPHLIDIRRLQGTSPSVAAATHLQRRHKQSIARGNTNVAVDITPAPPALPSPSSAASASAAAAALAARTAAPSTFVTQLVDTLRSPRPNPNSGTAAPSAASAPALSGAERRDHLLTMMMGPRRTQLRNPSQPVVVIKRKG
jgi:hypothetical protein